MDLCGSDPAGDGTEVSGPGCGKDYSDRFEEEGESYRIGEIRESADPKSSALSS